MIAETKREIKLLQRQLDREIDQIILEIRKNHPEYVVRQDAVDQFLEAVTRKYQINTDKALVLHNRICFLKES